MACLAETFNEEAVKKKRKGKNSADGRKKREAAKTKNTNHITTKCCTTINEKGGTQGPQSGQNERNYRHEEEINEAVKEKEEMMKEELGEQGKKGSMAS